MTQAFGGEVRAGSTARQVQRAVPVESLLGAQHSECRELFQWRVCWKRLIGRGHHGPFGRAAILTAATLPASVCLWAAEGPAHTARGPVPKCVWSWVVGFGRTRCEKWNVCFYFSLTVFFSFGDFFFFLACRDGQDMTDIFKSSCVLLDSLCTKH